MKLDYALSGPVPWTAEECLRAATVHLGGTLAEIAPRPDAVPKSAPEKKTDVGADMLWRTAIKLVDE